MRVGVSLCILQWIRMRFRKLQCRHAGEKGLLSLPFNNLEHQREMERDQLNAWPNAASAKVPSLSQHSGNHSTLPSMSTLPVLAEAHSKLHADIAIIRLLRAGIRAEKISAIFPRGRAPNSVCCWLTSFHRVPIAAKLPVAAAGLLGRLFRKGVNAHEFDQQLENLGLTNEMTTRLIEKMEDGRIVLCVHARNEAEAAVAWHIFHHVAAEDIVCPAGYFEIEPRGNASSRSLQLSGVAA